jgi:hypothetical protein
VAEQRSILLVRWSATVAHLKLNSQIEAKLKNPLQLRCGFRRLPPESYMYCSRSSSGAAFGDCLRNHTCIAAAPRASYCRSEKQIAFRGKASLLAPGSRFSTEPHDFATRALTRLAYPELSRRAKQFAWQRPHSMRKMIGIGQHANGATMACAATKADKLFPLPQMVHPHKQPSLHSHSEAPP